MKSRLETQDLAALGALAPFLVLPFVAPTWLAGDFAMYFAYALLALSLAFIWGHCGLLSLGHAVYFGVGAYAMSVTTLGMIPGLASLRSTWAGLLLAIVLTGGLAFALGWFFFAARGLAGAFLGVMTLALAFIFERLAINASWLGGLNGLMNVPALTLGLNGGAEIVDPVAVYFLMLAVVVAVTAALRLVAASDFGVTLAAIRENELRVAALGHDARALKIRAFTLAGAVAGLAGALFVTQFGFASPSLIGFSLSADALIWVALGGRKTLISALLGALALRFLESRLSGALGALWPLALGLIFMASVVLFPDGLFGEAIGALERWRRRR